MKIAMIGMGRMGLNMTTRLIRGGHEVVAFDRDAKSVASARANGAIPVGDLSSLVKALPTPRVIWIMLPMGPPTESTISALAAHLSPGDVIIDGGNSYFKDDMRRAVELKKKSILYMDAGTSGGVFGLERGYCLMVGAELETFKLVEPILKTLAPGDAKLERTKDRTKTTTAESGYLHCGPVGSGHYVKMIHNGIEYGMMQAFAEGFDIMKNANAETVAGEHRLDLSGKLNEIAEVWRRGSVVSSWLLDLIANSLSADSTLSKFKGSVQDSGEGRWTVQAAIEQATPANVLTSALYTRFRSRESNSFAEKLLSGMRFQFGGHAEAVRKED